MSFDLNSFSGLSDAQEDGIEVSITHPKTGEPIGIVVKVAGPDSAKQKAARAAVTNERIEKKVRKITADRIESEAIDVAAKSIISWSGLEVDGKVLDCTVANAVMVMKRWPFFLEQVQSVSDDRANFIKT